MLLILAMVSIKLVWDGGIITHAQNAVNVYNEAQTNELAQLNELIEQMKPLGGSSGDNNSGPEANWWEFRGTEETELAPYIQDEVMYGIAHNNEGYYVCRVKGIFDNINLDYIMLIGKTTMYIILLNDSTVDFYNNENNESYEKRKMV